MDAARETLLPVLAERLSAAAFDPHHDIDETTVDLLLQAAGRAPSAGNSQPWSFIVGRRGDAVHDALVDCLAPSTRRWAPAAGLLLVNLAQIRVEDGDLEYSEFSHYDLGQAVAHLTVQAGALGLSVHQFRAFDRDAVAAAFDVADHWEATSMAAVGAPSGPTPRLTPDGHSSSTPERRSLDEITWARV
ncbi:nitroreductase family protein [Gordonia sp. (in: high G+C Gram-positive bacteria)]|uniref:nitroreductase family protein n=1 Tax=Gordonia sp. (in: high G+C Gram-positive bacteria) TaxID=84139 RepID=UPI0039E68463